MSVRFLYLRWLLSSSKYQLNSVILHQNMFLHMKLFPSAVSDGLQVAHQRKERPRRKEILEDASLGKEKKEHFKDLITEHIE